MDILINTDVVCADGLLGKMTHVVLLPVAEKIAHIVVVRGMHPETGYLVPAGRIVESMPDLIRLDCTRGELSKIPVFDQVEFLPSSLTRDVNPNWIWPSFLAPEASFITIVKEMVPVNGLAVRRGAGVDATDGYAGRVDGFRVDPKDNHITHLVLRDGHL
jgi:hypothetical protein